MFPFLITYNGDFETLPYCENSIKKCLEKVRNSVWEFSRETLKISRKPRKATDLKTRTG